VRHRLLLLLVALFSSLVLGAGHDNSNGANTKEEVQKLQGIWQVTKFIDHSEDAAPTDEIKGFTFEFQADRLTMRKSKDDKGREQKYNLNPSKKPKWIDIGVREGSPLGEGIYKLEGDQLTICVVGSTNSKNPTLRPSEFKAKKDRHSLFVLKKVDK
jgi:uncharacterized protein (TIGR03067 family)